MDKATRQMLNDNEQSIIRLIESKRFATLDAEELIDLHTRVRRVRNKYATLVRRRGAAKVKKTGSRALATKAIGRTSAKAELFEDALSTVSARLAKVTAANAKSLKADRLAAARAVKKGSANKGAGTTAIKGKAKGKANGKGTAKKAAKRAPKSSTKTPASARSRAATRSSGKRKQAKRDARR